MLGLICPGLASFYGVLLTEPVGTLLREAAVRSKGIGLVRVFGPQRL